MAWAGYALQGVGSWMSVMGQNQQMKAAQATAKYNEAANLRAANLEEKASLEEQHIARSQARQYLKSIKADMIAQGGQPNLAILLEAASNMESDIVTNAMNRNETIFGLRKQAEIEKWQGKVAVKTAKIGMWATMFGSAGNAASQAGAYYKQVGGGAKPPASFVPTGSPGTGSGTNPSSGSQVNIWHGFTGQKKYGTIY